MQYFSLTMARFVKNIYLQESETLKHINWRTRISRWCERENEENVARTRNCCGWPSSPLYPQTKAPLKPINRYKCENVKAEIRKSIKIMDIFFILLRIGLCEWEMQLALQNPKLDNWHYFYFYPKFIAKTTSKGLRIKLVHFSCC